MFYRYIVRGWVKIFILLFTFAAGSFSCVPNREVVYLNDPQLNTSRPVDYVNQRNNYKLQPRDVLSIKVKTVDVETSDYFNLGSGQGFMQLNPAGLYLNGYSLDNDGYIRLPEAGRLYVGGLTIDEAQERVYQALSEYLNNATILVKLVSFKITVLGEVRDPGYFYVYNDQATILEALGLAGDITDFGNRENVTLIRQTTAGSQAIQINMLAPDLIRSDYYFLQPNDVLYVQPLQAKNTRSNLSTFTLLSVLFGAISSTVLVLNFLDN